jgi:hypothetical protein
LHGALQSFDLETEILRLREEREGPRNAAITLLKGEGLSVVLLGNKEGRPAR